MIDPTGVGKLLFELIQVFKETKDNVKKEDNKEPGFLEKKSVQKGFLAGTLTYSMAGIYAISVEVASMAVSGPKQIAALALFSPPIASTIVFSFATVYQSALLVRAALAIDPHVTGTPESTEWRRNKGAELWRISSTLIVCATCLAASVVPIPGASNALGAAALATFAGVSAIQYGLKNLNEYVKKEQKKGNSAPITALVKYLLFKTVSALITTPTALVKYLLFKTVSALTPTALIKFVSREENKADKPNLSSFLGKALSNSLTAYTSKYSSAVKPATYVSALKTSSLSAESFKPDNNFNSPNKNSNRQKLSN